jgi:hypothetical protein
MKRAFRGSSICIAALGAAIITVGSASASSATLDVTNDGADSATCGAQTKPCRTISQAIDNAADGDSIEVGAGTYGNLSGDPNFAGPGDEHAQTGNIPQQGCIVCINKGVHIYSLHGAAVTVIQSIPSAFPSTVMIQSDGVIFGQAGGGFTLTGGNANGVILDMNAPNSTSGIVLKRNVTVAGNVDVGDGNGFVFNGLQFTDDRCPVAACISTATVTFADNESINNGAGFNVTVNTYNPPIVLQSNLAQGGGTGFSVATGFQNEAAMSLSAGNVSLLGNVAAHNGFGFDLTLVGRTEKNTAAGNSQAGFRVVPSGTFRGNSALGNAGPGIVMNYGANFNAGAFGLTPLSNNYSPFTQNNFYGNDRNRPALVISVGPIAGPNPGPSAHCGVLNLGDLSAAELASVGQGSLDPQTLQASGNFWGSAQGPAPTGVGDAAGGVCDQNGAVTIVKPFATTPFAITSWP